MTLRTDEQDMRQLKQWLGGCSNPTTVLGQSSITCLRRDPLLTFTIHYSYSVFGQDPNMMMRLVNGLVE